MSRLEFRQMAHRGFTIVELLVVVAVIGVLVGIALPAVQSVRESARMTTCKNNLRNQALGMLTYESANKRFPSGQDAPQQVDFFAPDWTGHSGVGHLWHLLPYLEETAVQKMFLENARDRVFWGTLPGLIEASDIWIPVLHCPTDYTVPIRTINYSQLNEATISATVFFQTPVENENYPGYTNYLGNRGTDLYQSPAKPIVRTGIFFEGSEIKIRDVTDGLSNTVLMGEAVGGTNGLASLRKIDVRHSIFQNGIGGGVYLFFDITDDITDNLSTMFSSQHNGGHLVNFSFVDGHVDTISSSIDYPLMFSLTTRSGVFK